VIIPFFLLLLFGFFSFSSPPFSKQNASGLLEVAAAPLSTSYSQQNEGSEAPTSALNSSAEAPAPLSSAKPREASPPLIVSIGFGLGAVIRRITIIIICPQGIDQSAINHI
jgi:Flp pilus assembly protein TadG